MGQWHVILEQMLCISLSLVHKIMVHFIINDILDLIKYKVLRMEGYLSICTLGTIWGHTREFPDGPVVRILHFHCWRPGFNQRSHKLCNGAPKITPHTHQKQNWAQATFQISSKLFICYSSFLHNLRRFRLLLSFYIWKNPDIEKFTAQRQAASKWYSQNLNSSLFQSPRLTRMQHGCLV